MYFKRLEIFGFKSFADKTVLNFEPGITAVVGPNGCGKSNIFDAIRWVLGEQSVKELRGSSMEDVIFNGTDKKPALGFAEVSLTFSNESRMLAVEYDEVTVTRRLFRSGESEYLMNKTQVRLKDIIELFLGTGVGAEAYSLIQQGKVDLVVSAKPEERRMILDEAAGITKYKAKKKEALNKLKDTEDNLLRINDIIIEVKRQISSLERQASKARKYKEELERLKGLEIQYANHQLKTYAEQNELLQQKMAELKAQEIKLTEEMKEFTDLLAHENSILQEIEDKINDLSAQEIKLDNQIDINNRQIGFNEERLANIDHNEKRLNEQKEQLTQRCRQQQEKIEEVTQSLTGIKQLLETNNELLRDKRLTLASIVSAVNEAKATIKNEEEKILDVTSRQVSVKNRVTDIMKELQGCLARKRRLEMENAKVTSEKTEVDQRLITISSNLESVTHNISHLQSDFDQKNQTLNGLTEQLQEMDAVIGDLEKKKVFLISQKEFIEKLSIQYQDIPDPSVEGHLITSVPPQKHHTGIIGKVREVLPANDEKTEMLKAVFPNQSHLYEIVCEAKFIELDPLQISQEIETIAQEIAVKIQLKATLISRIDEQKRLLSQMEETIHDQEKTFSIYEAQKKDILGELNKLQQEVGLVTMELQETQESMTGLRKSEEEATFQLDSLNQELQFSQTQIKDREDRIAAKSQEREETTVLIAQTETEVESFKDKLSSQESNLKMFVETLDQWLEEIKKIEDERAQIVQKRDDYINEIETLTTTIEEIKQQKESSRSVLSGYERQKEEISQRVNSVQANMVSYNNDVEEIRNTVHTLEMNGQQVQFKEKEIKDRLMQAYRINIDEVNQQPAPAAEGEQLVAQEAPTAITMNIPDLEAELERLRKRCESFGAVNLVAIEEFDELKGRFEFLTKQQSDLITAKESLHQTILKINRQTRQMFMETFTKVSEEFRIYFRMLFGGGEAQLILLDPENVLESGIEIVARPPGKKLQNISLLSGGEKSLTAIALVFGVFKVNPSPFCVLDEIDAALDESNVGRFSYLLKDFAKIAQFIVITHNKKTISSADVMYGITMQETGVSKIVSVKFGDQDKKQQQEAVEVGV